jgi:hypothetical protein
MLLARGMSREGKLSQRAIAIARQLPLVSQNNSGTSDAEP